MANAEIEGDFARHSA